ncbi:hypothetical protein, partial [Xanthomonas oryzae]|uniref:hypothetical protein n=1 Tax=Xanthomonas oryzae TaxID=347 RepID=UPI003CF00556
MDIGRWTGALDMTIACPRHDRATIGWHPIIASSAHAVVRPKSRHPAFSDIATHPAVGGASVNARGSRQCAQALIDPEESPRTEPSPGNAMHPERISALRCLQRRLTTKKSDAAVRFASTHAAGSPPRVKALINTVRSLDKHPDQTDPTPNSPP